MKSEPFFAPKQVSFSVPPGSGKIPAQPDTKIPLPVPTAMESLYVLRFGGSAAAFVQYVVKIHFLVGFFLVCCFRVI